MRTPDNRPLDSLWWAARHEAAHFFAAVYFDLHVSRVCLKFPNTRNHRLKGVLGAVHFYDEPIPGCIIATLAGVVTDIHILGVDACRTDAGAKLEYKRAKSEVQFAMQDKWNKELFMGHDHTPTNDEVNARTIELFEQAYKLTLAHWGHVETIAGVFMSRCTKSTGILPPRILTKTVELTCDYLRSTGWHHRVE